MIYKVEVDTSGFIIDKTGINTGILLPLNFNFEEVDANSTANLVNLISAGMTADDLTKLKANGVI